MASFYNRVSKTVIRLIDKYGVDTVFRSIVSVPNPNPSKPPINTSIDITYKAVFTKIDLKEIDGIRILTGDMRVLVKGNITSDFKINGQIVDQVGAVWKVIEILPVSPGPINVMFKIQVRK